MSAPPLVKVVSAVRQDVYRPWKYGWRLALSCGHELTLRFRRAYKMPWKVRKAERTWFGTWEDTQLQRAKAWEGAEVPCHCC